MLGKRPRQMRRTVSISMLGSGSTMSEILTPPEYPKDKQKPHLEVPACYTQRQVVLSDNFVSEPEKAQTEIGACYAAPVLPFSHSGSRPRERKETGAVGLSIVAALHADKKIEVKDYREKVISALVSYRPVYQHNLLPSAQPSLACQVPHKQMQPQAMQMQAPSSSHRKSSSASHKNQNFVVPPAMHFLEACCYCRRRLSQGRDIYMYRGDKAFCSEQCRDQQILIDERKDKCFLSQTALRMRLAAEPAHSSSQRSRALVTSTAAG